MNKIIKNKRGDTSLKFYHRRNLLNSKRAEPSFDFHHGVSLLKSKKGWIRIVESFIAVMIVMSVLLVVIARQPTFILTQEEELTKVQQNILDQVIRDPALRNEVLLENTAEVNTLIAHLIPIGYSFATAICQDITMVCSPPGTVPFQGEIFVEEVIITATLENYDQPKLLKLFFWEPVCGDGKCEAPGENEDTCSKDCAGVCTENWIVAETGTCIDGQQTVTWQDVNNCGTELGRPAEVGDCDIAKLSATDSNLRKNIGANPGCAINENWWYFDTKLEETSNVVGITIETRQKCYNWNDLSGVPKSKCDDLKSEPSMFTNPSIIAGGYIERKDNYICLITGFTYSMTETFSGIDDNGNLIEDNYIIIELIS